MSYLLLSGRHVRFRVVAIHVDKGGRVPVVDVIVGESEADGAADARGKHLLTSGNGSHASRFMIGQMGEREYPAQRLTIIRRKSRGWGPGSWPPRAALLPSESGGSTADAHGGIGVTGWKLLDGYLESAFGLK